MVTTKFGPLVAAIAAALTQLAAHRFRPSRPVAQRVHEANPPAAEAADSPESTAGFIFYTLDDGFLPYGSDVLHWWRNGAKPFRETGFRNPVPHEPQADIKKGDLV